MHSLHYRGEVSYFSFLGLPKAKKHTIKHAKKSILEKNIKCPLEYMDKFILIKQIILDKLDNGLTIEEYKDIKSTLIALDNIDILENIDLIIEILSKENSEIIDLINEEICVHNYKSLLERKESINEDGKKTYITVNKEVTIGLIFLFIKEILRDYKTMLYNFSEKLLYLNGEVDYQLLLQISNDIYENKDNEYLKIIQNQLKERFSYLNETGNLSSIYSLFENNIRLDTIRILNFRYNKEHLEQEKFKSGRRNIREGDKKYER